MHSDETAMASTGKISSSASPMATTPLSPSPGNSNNTSKATRPKIPLRARTTTIATTTMPATRPKHLPSHHRTYSSPAVPYTSYTQTLQPLDPRPLQELHNERSYLLHSLHKQGERSTRLFQRYAAVQARLTTVATQNPPSPSSPSCAPAPTAATAVAETRKAETRKAKREASLLRAKIAEATQQEQLTLLRLGEIHLEVQNRGRWMWVGREVGVLQQLQVQQELLQMGLQMGYQQVQLQHQQQQQQQMGYPHPGFLGPSVPFGSPLPCGLGLGLGGPAGLGGLGGAGEVLLSFSPSSCEERRDEKGHDHGHEQQQQQQQLPRQEEAAGEKTAEGKEEMTTASDISSPSPSSLGYFSFCPPSFSLSSGARESVSTSVLSPLSPCFVPAGGFGGVVALDGSHDGGGGGGGDVDETVVFAEDIWSRAASKTDGSSSLSTITTTPTTLTTAESVGDVDEPEAEAEEVSVVSVVSAADDHAQEGAGMSNVCQDDVEKEEARKEVPIVVVVQGEEDWVGGVGDVASYTGHGENGCGLDGSGDGEMEEEEEDAQTWRDKLRRVSLYFPLSARSEEKRMSLPYLKNTWSGSRKGSLQLIAG